MPNDNIKYKKKLFILLPRWCLKIHSKPIMLYVDRRCKVVPRTEPVNYCQVNKIANKSCLHTTEDFDYGMSLDCQRRYWIPTKYWRRICVLGVTTFKTTAQQVG